MRTPVTDVHPTRFSRTSRLERLRASLIAASILLCAPALGKPDLHPLAAQPDSAALEAALASGADPEQRSDGGETPLMAPVRAQRTDAVKALLAAGADPDNTSPLGESSVHLAAAGDRSILKTLLTAGANPNARDAGGVTPLMRLDSETLRFRMEGSLQLVLERAYEQDAQLQRWPRAKAIESIERRSAGF